MTQLDRPSTRPVYWRPITHWPQAQRPSPWLQTWLTHPGSLTARLITASKRDFAVKVLRQQIGRPTLDECRALGIGTQSLALIREVVLLGQGRPWVFARSLLPLSSLTGRLRHLRKQGNRPLGAFLFSQPDLARSPLQVATIHQAQAYVPSVLIGQNTLWGRRSIFYLDTKPLLVSEVFLPEFIASLEREQA